MHEAAFARAALPAPCQVLGMTLRAYSIGHEVYLEREVPGNCKLQIANCKSECQALTKSVLICCQGWEELRAMRSDWLIGLKLWIWKQRVRGVDWARQRAAFEAYRAEGSLEFPLSDIVRPGSGAPSRPPGSPFLLRLHQFLVIKLGLGQGAAWDYPLGLAKMQWAAYWEEEGGLQVYNYQDAAHDEFVAKCEAEEAAAAAAVQSPESNVQSSEGIAESQMPIAKPAKAGTPNEGGSLA